MSRIWVSASFLIVACCAATTIAQRPGSNDVEFIWPNLAPGETDRNTGETLPHRSTEKPRITRVVKVRRPTIAVIPPSAEPNGTAVLILPGGGFGKVVPDLEGSEAADFLGELGITCFVLNYRTNEVTPKDEPAWRRPLQDGQRGMRWIREHAERWHIEEDRVGLLAFSAGGQVGAMLMTATDGEYEAIDDLDKHSFHPDFSMLVYPWRCYDEKTDKLLPQIRVTEKSPESFIVHTHDDASTSLGAVYIYAALKKHNVPAELHIYETGGHGYGTRPRANSNIGTWKHRAVDWLKRRI